MQATKAYLIEDKDLQAEYATADEFYQNLLAIHATLSLENKGIPDFQENLSSWCRQLKSLASTLPPIDMRQDSSVLEACVASAHLLVSAVTVTFLRTKNVPSF